MSRGKGVGSLTGWTPIERLRIWAAGVILGTRIWRRMCDAGFCPQGIHDQVEQYRAKGIEL